MLAGFFNEGLERGERLAYFAPVPCRSRFPGYLGRERTHALIQSGRLVMLPAEDACEPWIDFNPDTLLAAWEDLTRASLADGYPALRAAGEAGWLLRHLGAGHAFARYEFGADLLAESLPLTALCCYDRRILKRQTIDVARALHPLALGPDGAGAGFSIIAKGDGVVAVGGELDVVHAERIAALLESAAGRIRALDLSSLRFTDVTGLRALARAAVSIAAANGVVRFLGAPAMVRRLWGMLRLSELVPVTFE